MSPEEKNIWIYAAVAFLVPVVYVGYVLAQLRGTTVAEFGFQRPLLIAIGASIAASVVAHALFAEHGGRKDQRDRDIHRHGEFVGFFVLAAGVLPALALAMLEVPYFWIANAIYLAYILNALTSSTAKLIAYRRGL